MALTGVEFAEQVYDVNALSVNQHSCLRQSQEKF